MRKFFLSVLLCGLMAVLFGCSSNKPQSECLTIYSTLDSEFVTELGREFVEERNLPLDVQVVSRLDREGTGADLVLTEMRQLMELSYDDLLEPLNFSCVRKLDKKFRAEDNTWVGVLYDPLVCLVNHEFAKGFDTEKLQSWQQLGQDLPVRMVLQNFHTPEAQRGLLCGIVTEFGEDEAFRLMQSVDRNTNKYVSFPFTAVRLVVTGDDDVALVRRSQVFRYLEHKFPAFVLTPRNGTPAILYGAGVLKAGVQSAIARQFVEWLELDSDARRVNLRHDTGLLFFLNYGAGAALVRPEQVWLNKKYISWTERDRLSQKWLRDVRFGYND